jgi:hypothetical protein
MSPNTPFGTIRATLLLDPHRDEQVAVPLERHVVHVTRGDAREQHRIARAQARAPREDPVDRIAGREAAAREHQRTHHGDRHRDRRDNADQHFIASAH